MSSKTSRGNKIAPHRPTMKVVILTAKIGNASQVTIKASKSVTLKGWEMIETWRLMDVQTSSRQEWNQNRVGDSAMVKMTMNTCAYTAMRVPMPSISGLLGNIPLAQELVSESDIQDANERYRRM